MRVLNVGASLDPVTGGGEAEKSYQLSRYTAKSGIDCSILTTDVGLSKQYASQIPGVEVLACPCAWRRFYVPRGCLREIRAIVARADIIHIMGHWTILNAIVYWHARRMGKPYVVCPAGALSIYGRSKLIKRIYNAIAGRAIMRNADYCIAVTQAEVPDMKAYGVDPHRIVEIPNGVSFDDLEDVSPAAFREAHGLRGTKIVLFMGRLNHIKGPDLLVRAFCAARERTRGHTLVIAGPDEGMLGELRRIAEAAGASEQVRFIGYVGGSEKLQAYKAADLLVIPSRQESMSIVVLEAGRAGTPVLITDQCYFDIVEAVGGGKVVGATVEQLAEGLVELLGDEPRLARMSVKIGELTRTTFDWNVIIKQYVTLYEQVLRDHAVH